MQDSVYSMMTITKSKMDFSKVNIIDSCAKSISVR